MNWLVQFFKTATSWVFKNPILIVLVIFISLYNKFFSNVGFDVSHLNPLRADSIWLFALAAKNVFLTLHGALIAGSATFASSVITIFNTSAMLAVFAKQSSPGIKALHATLSLRTLEYFILQILCGVVFGTLFLAIMYLIVPVAGIQGIVGTAIISICTLIAYPVFYIILSTGSLILTAPVKANERWLYVRTLCNRQNFPRLLTFYLVRIGTEAILAYGVLILASLVHLPTLISALLIIFIVSIPFALVRTTGLIMKLDMLRNTPWFKSQFANYYQYKNY
ncbi:MAG: hypothetical protein JWL75_71 [Parcubacteria group bacterium]|nr:hypothetical protein [Parcubacteria group bacterium]